jgi:hypothetical protein
MRWLELPQILSFEDLEARSKKWAQSTAAVETAHPSPETAALLIDVLERELERGLDALKAADGKAALIIPLTSNDCRASNDASVTANLTATALTPSVTHWTDADAESRSKWARERE